MTLRTFWSNDIGGTGSFAKNGTGSLTIFGNSTYTGSTQINGGFLRSMDRLLAQ